MASLPAGTVTLVFSDIVGSTRLLEELGDAYGDLLTDHHRLMNAAADRHGGIRVDSAGDGLFFSFPTARGALLASVEAQQSIAGHDWPQGADVQVRIGIHTGEPVSSAFGYVGMDVHRAARICSAGHGGQILVSQAARTLMGSTLPEGIGLSDLGDHRLKDLANPERLYQAVAPGLRTDFPPVRSLDTLPNNLPRQLSSFVGRVQEIAAAEERLATTSMLTLTGPGGVGKTRLALEIGAHLVDAFQDGVWLVELATITDGGLIRESLASVLRVKEQPGQDLLATLCDAIAARRMLLILDSCEHLLEPIIDVVDELLHGCPEIQVITTSREALGMAGESLMPVPSMSVPDPAPVGGAVAIERLADSDAVQLFVERAGAVQPTFALTAANADAVAQICRRLDGIPLAVELAAARVRALPPQQIAMRLDDRFRLLTGGSRTALPRHRTLRATMDWSFDLLPEPEGALLPRLAVFAGSFSLEAAEAVCSGGPVDPDEMLDLLSHLIDKSLLLPEEDATEARYRMLETVRDYAQERLVASDGANEVYARHRDWFAGLVRSAQPAFFAGPEVASWLSRLSRDHDNLRAALQWSHEDPDGADAELALASGLWRFWEIRGHLVEGGAWLERALARTGGHVTALRANALTGAGVLAAQRGDYPAAAAFHEASLAINRELGHPTAVATACNNLAGVAEELGDYARARALYQECIDIARASDNPQGAAFGLVNLADVAARQGEDDEADQLYAQSLKTFETYGDRWGMAHATSRLAQAGRRRGDLALARTRYADALAIYRQIGDPRGAARTLASLGDVTAEDGDAATAESLYRESLALRDQLGDRAGIASMLERLARVTLDLPEQAARLIGQAAALRESIGAPMTAAAAANLDQDLARLREALGGDGLEAALSEGRLTTLGAALSAGAERGT